MLLLKATLHNDYPVFYNPHLSNFTTRKILTVMHSQPPAKGLQQSQGHFWGKGYRNGEGQGRRARVVGREGLEGGDNCS